MLACRIEADSSQELSTEEVAEASSRLSPDKEGVAPGVQNSKRQQQQASTSSGRMSESQPPSFKNALCQVSKSRVGSD